MAGDLKDLYREGVAHTLGGFQLLEEGLKTYIGVYHSTVSQILKGRLHYGYEQSDIQEAPLGRLLTVFGKVCSNQALIAEMRALVRHRDEAAHQAFICLYGPGPGDQKLIEMVDANAKLGTQLSLLLPRLHAEMLKVYEVLQKSSDGGRADSHAA
jgi:hypothetical protein